MVRQRAKTVLVLWILALVGFGCIIPLSPRYEIPALKAWTLLSDDGRTLLVIHPPLEGVMTRIAEVRDGASGHLLRQFDVGNSGTPLASRDGSLLAVASEKGAVQLWDTRSGLSIAEIEGTKYYAFAQRPQIALSANGQRIAYASPRSNQPASTQAFDAPIAVRVWNANANVENLMIPDARPPVALSPDGKLLATSGDDQAARIWDAENGKLLATFAPHTFLIASLAFSPDGRRLASVANGTTPINAQADRRPTEVKLYDVSKSKELAAMDVPVMDVGRLSFDRSGQVLSADGTMLGRMAWHVGALPPRALPTALQAGATSADGAWLAVTQGEAVSLPMLPILNNQFVRVVNTATGETRADLRLTLPHDDEINSQIQPLAFTPDGATLIVHVTQRDTLWRRLVNGRYGDLLPKGSGGLNIGGELWGVDLATQAIKFRLPSQMFSVGAEARFADEGRLLLSRIQTGAEGQQITLAAWNLPPRRSPWALAVLGVLTAATAAGLVRRFKRRAPAES